MAWLFSYGTLQERSVQMANFGRLLEGRADVLPGYALGSLGHGKAAYLNVSESAGSEVSGVAYRVSEEELVAADRYEEGAGYGRIMVALRSGIEAWVYLKANQKSKGKN